MSKRKYKKGKALKTIKAFSDSKSSWFIVQYGDKFKTTHRSFLISWQYRLLESFLNKGLIFEAINIKDSIDKK